MGLGGQTAGCVHQDHIFATGPALGVFSVVLMLVIKWGWMGTFRPGNHYMWSWWAIRNEAFQHVFLGTAGSFFLRYLVGTPMLPRAAII